MKLEVGKTYLTRSGAQFTITRKVDDDSAYPYRCRHRDGYTLSWAEDGSYHRAGPQAEDLVEEVAKVIKEGHKP